MKKFFFRFWPVVIIFTVWFIFSSPYFLKGKAPFAATYQLNNFAPWSAYPQFAGPVKNGAMPDVITQIYPWRHLAIEVWKSGQVPFWNPYSFAGTPLLANYQSAVLSPFNLLFFIFPFVDSWSLLVLLQPLLAGFFTYIFVRALKRSEVASLISAISFMFCGFMTSWMGYATLGYAILPLPLALFAIEKYSTSQKEKFLTLLSLTIPLSFFSGHFQISIYFFIVVFSYILFKLIATREVNSFIKTIIFATAGLLMSLPQILPSVEFYSQSFRSNIFEKGEVIPWSYLPTFLSPDFFGNPVTRNDWFGHYAEWNTYIGVFPLVLAFYSMTVKKKNHIIFFAILSVSSLLLAFDSRVVDILVALRIPVLSTSAASRIIVLYSFSFSVLAAFGYDQLVLDFKEKKRKKILAFFAAFSLIFALLWAIIFLKVFIPIDHLKVAKNNLKLPTLIFIVTVALIIFGSMRKKFILSFSLLIIALISFDMLRFATKWQEFSPKNLVFVDVPVASAFAQISNSYRVMGNFGGEASNYFRLPSLEGYDALYIKRYGEFAASITDGKLKQSYRSVVMFPKDSTNTPAMINLMGTKYIVHKNADDGAGWTFPIWSYPGKQFTKIYEDIAYEIYENKDVYPRVFLVGQYIIERDSQKIINHLTSKNADLREQIILEEDPKIPQTEKELGLINVKKYTPNEVEIEVIASKSALLFMSDNYYKGWKANVDFESVPIYRANYAFRAIPITQGKHIVRFVYQPFSFILGIWLALGGVLIIITSLLFPRFLVRKT